MRRNQWAAALFAVLLFGLGTAVGALAHRYFTATPVSAKSAEDFRQHYVSDMRTKLSLSTTQVSQLQAILDDTKAKYKAVREQYHPAMLEIKHEQISRVKAILTPAQVPIYEHMVADHERQARDQEERDRVEELRHRHAPRPSPGQ